jgi:hypothetical protein
MKKKSPHCCIFIKTMPTPQAATMEIKSDDVFEVMRVQKCFGANFVVTEEAVEAALQPFTQGRRIANTKPITEKVRRMKNAWCIVKRKGGAQRVKFEGRLREDKFSVIFRESPSASPAASPARTPRAAAPPQVPDNTPTSHPVPPSTPPLTPSPEPSMRIDTDVPRLQKVRAIMIPIIIFVQTNIPAGNYRVYKKKEHSLRTNFRVNHEPIIFRFLHVVPH